ncbi:hypothetical protein VX159_00275 [Dechloromonas sp. ZY10]|uniref:ubiquinone biosynthesis accessory factor UbiJ n=1 Tax=Dechloromonas aquae TaxID=2664436 RepID=UPI003529546E
MLLPLLNRLIAKQSWAGERLAKHAGKQCLIAIGNVQFRVQIGEGGMLAAGVGNEPPPAVSITLGSDAPLRLISQPETIFSSTRIEGNVDFAEDLSFVFRNLELDIEGEIAKLIGDVPARRIGRALTSIQLQLREAAKRTWANTRDYAVNEAGHLLDAEEVREFTEKVSTLRDDLARLEKRIERL